MAMRYCGASISGDELVLVTVVRTDAGFEIEESATLKLKLNASTEQASVRAFFAALAGFVRNNNIDQIAIRGRQANGPYGSGATTFKIEGFLQVLENCSAIILMPVAITARVKRHKLAAPAGAFKYQSDAFLTACAAMAA